MSTVDTLQAAPSVRRVSFFSREGLWRLGTIALLVIVAIAMLMPFLWLVSSSLKLQHQVFQYPPTWIPNPPNWDNYVEALTYKPFNIYLRNSLIIIVLNEIAVLGSASLCAYGFARINFWGRDKLFALVIGTMMMPYVVLVVPTFIIFSRLGWIDSFLPLTVPQFFGGGAFNIFLLRQFMSAIPRDLEDAALIDGAGYFYIYLHVILPLVKPALTAIAIFTFIGVWNDFFGQLIYLNSNSNFTIALGLTLFKQLYGTKWNLLMAASVATMIPIIILLFIFQRRIIEGVNLTAGIQG